MVWDLFHKKDGATFSDCQKYRFALWRVWDETKPLVMFIGLNPSTANADTDDATIRRVKTIAANLGYGGVYMMNCFPLVSTNPDALKPFFLFQLAENLCSQLLNERKIKEVAEKCKDIIFAWGNFKVVTETGRDKYLINLFPNAKALYINKNGSPKHPLYCKSDIQPIPFQTLTGADNN